MKITAIDQKKDLYAVDHAFPNFFVNYNLSLNRLLKYDYRKDNVAGRLSRRSIKTPLPILTNFLMDEFGKYFQKKISKVLNYNIKFDAYNLWVDEEDFFMEKHIDSNGDTSRIGLQIYLETVDYNVGTYFYNEDGSLRHYFPFIKNTGYLMLNNQNQAHSAHIPVPKNHFRPSIYYNFTCDGSLFYDKY